MGPLRKELVIFGVLFLVGMVVLPVCIYIIGQNFIGEYSPDSGAFGLVTAIWGDLARFSIGAWILVLSPWGVIQMLRMSAIFWRGPARTKGEAES